MKVFVVLLLAIIAINGAPTNLDEKLRALQEQLYNIEKETGNEIAPKETFLGFVPQKRMVAWQPMKRGMDDTRTPLLHAIEARLAEVLRAGERLGINPEDVLQDLRARNQLQ
ncbi:unnamed protein product [Caenorhabditis bovis]|uniref:Uncharacterized protein n=1 Tax=Caenorhabditis bovis TaxID=2654633 RepID=A0A8S1F2S2_9PELO|nr:unnamed protein product [Caenorhabditis bovis]